VRLSRLVGPSTAPAIRPTRTLALLSLAHAFNHAQAALLPFVFLAIISEFGVSVADIAFLTAAGTIVAGGAQLPVGVLTRFRSRRSILGWGNVVLGGFMAVTALATSFLAFSASIILSRAGGSPQHPVGNALIAEQFPPERRGLAISSHIAGGNVGSVAVPLLATWLIAGIGWRWTLVLFGVPALLVGVAILAFVRESGAGRAAAIAYGSIRSAFRAVLGDRDQMLVLGSSVVASGGRGLGILDLFVPLYLALVIGIDTATVALMLTVLLVGSVPAPVVGGWLSDRFGRKPVIVITYLGGAASLVLLLLAGDDRTLLWIAIVAMGVFSFVESPQLQSMLADITRPGLRDASFATYFTVAFVSAALWVGAYGAFVSVLGESDGLRLAFATMAGASLVAAVLVLPIRARERTAEVRAEEAALLRQGAP
jgi:MFS family permease